MIEVPLIRGVDYGNNITPIEPELMVRSDLPENFTTDQMASLPYIIHADGFDTVWAKRLGDLIAYGHNGYDEMARDYDYGMELLKEDIDWDIGREKRYLETWKEFLPYEPLLPYIFTLIDWRKESDRLKEYGFERCHMYYPAYYVNLFCVSHVKALSRKLEKLRYTFNKEEDNV